MHYIALEMSLDVLSIDNLACKHCVVKELCFSFQSFVLVNVMEGENVTKWSVLMRLKQIKRKAGVQLNLNQTKSKYM